MRFADVPVPLYHPPSCQGRGETSSSQSCSDVRRGRQDGEASVSTDSAGLRSFACSACRIAEISLLIGGVGDRYASVAS